MIERIEQEYFFPQNITLPPKELISSDDDNVHAFFRNYNPIISFDLPEGNSCIKRFKGHLYYGEMHNSYRHGLGILLGAQNMYEGLWQNNLKQGKGFEKLKNGGLYYGQYLNGLPEGEGFYRWPKGDYYAGEWRGGKKHGLGKWKTINGDVYVGEWEDGMAQGEATLTTTNGDVYTGTFRQNLKHGVGKEVFKNGDIYQGHYANGRPNGKGVYRWNNGSSYKGIFTNGLRHGKGVLHKKMNDGMDVYDGEYANDRKCGYGIYKWSNGTIYKGNFLDDKRNGKGEIIWNDGASYVGEWSQGLMNGYGCMKTGDIELSGVWRDNILIEPDEKLKFDQLAMISLTMFPNNYNLKTILEKDVQPVTIEPVQEQETQIRKITSDAESNQDQVNFQRASTNTNTTNSKYGFLGIQKMSPRNFKYYAELDEQEEINQTSSLKNANQHHFNTQRINKSIQEISKSYELPKLNETTRVSRAVQTVFLKDAITQTKSQEPSTRSPNNSVKKLQMSVPLHFSFDNHRILPKNRIFIKKSVQRRNPISPKRALKYHQTGFDFQQYEMQLRNIRRRHPQVKFLTEKELKLWVLKMKRMKLDPKRYENIWDLDVIRRIRKHIYPPVWLPSGIIHYDINY